MAAQWTCIWSPTSTSEEETASQCFPTVKATFTARGTSGQEKSPQLQETTSRHSSPAISLDPAASQHIHPQPLWTFPDYAVLAVS